MKELKAMEIMKASADMLRNIIRKPGCEK